VGEHPYFDGTIGWLDTDEVRLVPFIATNWGQFMAYASMITVPVLVMFIAFQRAFINSIASSGVKG
jgi:ABC-type glycerol-3-phosphate transport system permease component